jgi:hypothetical protein
MLNDPIRIVGAARTPMGGLSARRSLRSLNVRFAHVSARRSRFASGARHAE